MVTGESTKEAVKTIVQGMPAVAVYPWLLTPVLFAAQAATGATRIRHSLRPLQFEGGSLDKLGQNRAARTRICAGNHVAAHPSRRPPAAGSSGRGRHTRHDVRPSWRGARQSRASRTMRPDCQELIGWQSDGNNR